MVVSEVFFKDPCVKSCVVSLRCHWDWWALKKAGPSERQIIVDLGVSMGP